MSEEEGRLIAEFRAFEREGGVSREKTELT